VDVCHLEETQDFPTEEFVLNPLKLPRVIGNDLTIIEKLIIYNILSIRYKAKSSANGD